jgi:hypothetical protein
MPIPELFDPVLSFLSSNLPPPAYSFILSFLSHSIALFASLLTLASTLISTKPWEWDTRSLLPPLISLFAAYLALLSLYRTASWIFRVSVWFVKWGAIFAALIAGVRWYATNTNGVAIHRAGGFASELSGLLVDMLNVNGQAQGQRAARHFHTKPSTSRDRTKGKPKPWHSFAQHRGWQEENAGGGDDGNVQKIIGEIVGAAGQAMKDSRWWEAARSVVQRVGEDPVNGQPPKANSKGKGSR